MHGLVHSNPPVFSMQYNVPTFYVYHRHNSTDNGEVKPKQIMAPLRNRYILIKSAYPHLSRYPEDGLYIPYIPAMGNMGTL